MGRVGGGQLAVRSWPDIDELRHDYGRPTLVRVRVDVVDRDDQIGKPLGSPSAERHQLTFWPVAEPSPRRRSTVTD